MEWNLCIHVSLPAGDEVGRREGMIERGIEEGGEYRLVESERGKDLIM